MRSGWRRGPYSAEDPERRKREEDLIHIGLVVFAGVVIVGAIGYMFSFARECRENGGVTVVGIVKLQCVQPR